MQPLTKEARKLYSDKRAEIRGSENKGFVNKGLIFERFYDGYDDSFKDGKHSDTEQLRELIGSCGDANQIITAARRRYDLVKSLQGEHGVFSTDWHFVTGMGNSHPAENGFTWHHTLGTPYLPGSSVKGLLRGWMEAWVYEGDDNKAKREAVVHAWFGRNAKAEGSKDNGKAGDLIFFDAIPVEQPDVLLDIMTPHMGKWYEQGGDTITPESQPGDWHSPVPVNFLVTEKAKFLFAIAPRTEEAKAYVKEAMDYLKEALAWLGAGAKTAAGYGHMSFDEYSTQFLFASDEEKQALLEKQKKMALEEETRKSAERLEAAGITVSSETWPKALIKETSPGSGEIVVEYEGKTAKGKFYSELSKKTKEKAKKKKAYLEVDIEQQGNQVVILKIREIPPA